MTHDPQGRADVRDMAIVHQYYRREFDLAPRILRDLQPEQVERRAAALEWLPTTIFAMHHHHIAEDELMYPLMVGSAPQDLLVLMEVQHQIVDAGVQAIEANLPAWQANEPGSAEALAAAYDAIYPELVKHLDDEEREIVPLIGDSLTAEQYARKGTSGNHFEPHMLMMMFGAMIEQCSVEDANFMLAFLPEEVRRSWDAYVGAEYRATMALLRGSLKPIAASFSAV